MLDLAGDTNYSLIMALTVEKNVVGGLFFKFYCMKTIVLKIRYTTRCFSKM